MKRLTRSETAEAVAGVALMLGVLAYWSLPVAVFALGLLLLLGALGLRA